MTDFRHERGLIHTQLRVKQGILTPFLLSGAASLSFSFAFGTFILRFASPDDNVSYQIFAFVVIPEISHNDTSYIKKRNQKTCRKNTKNIKKIIDRYQNT